MQLLYKPDWEETKERFKKWWTGEYFGRCAMAVYAPISDRRNLKEPPLPEKTEDRWLDFDYLIRLNEYRMRTTFYGGEAFPLWTPGYPGWDFIPTYLGCRVTLSETTGWLDPIISEGDLKDHDYNKIKIAPDSKWWLFAIKMHTFAAQQTKGKALAGIQAIGGCGDTLAGIRGSGKLLLDVIDAPEYVRKFDQYLMKMWMEVYEKFYQIIKDATEGSTCWFNLWSPGKFYCAHNDFSYMISPEMFKEIFLPSLEMQTNYLDHTVYHVDGIGAFAHVDALCELPHLQAIQILPGAGKPSPLHYMDVLKKVQKAGKNLHISIPPEEVEIALSELSAKGLFVATSCATEAEAHMLLEQAKKWSKNRKL